MIYSCWVILPKAFHAHHCLCPHVRSLAMCVYADTVRLTVSVLRITLSPQPQHRSASCGLYTAQQCSYFLKFTFLHLESPCSAPVLQLQPCDSMHFLLWGYTWDRTTHMNQSPPFGGFPNVPHAYTSTKQSAIYGSNILDHRLNITCHNWLANNRSFMLQDEWHHENGALQHPGPVTIGRNLRYCSYHLIYMCIMMLIICSQPFGNMQDYFFWTYVV